jgi:hypothetical protein
MTRSTSCDSCIQFVIVSFAVELWSPEVPGTPGHPDRIAEPQPKPTSQVGVVGNPMTTRQEPPTFAVDAINTLLMTYEHLDAGRFDDVVMMLSTPTASSTPTDPRPRATIAPRR